MTSVLDRIATTVAGLQSTGRQLGAVERILPDTDADARASEGRRGTSRVIGPLDGVPFGVKANIDLNGVPTTSGLAIDDLPPATKDAWVVHLLRKAGAIPVATTTMAPMAIGAVTEHPRLGPCRNPHDLDRHAGGSSGGSGAVVGAGIVPFALGSDTMGSVRIPAAYCGAFAWLPTHGCVSSRGMVPLAEPLDTIGVIAADPYLLRDIAQVVQTPDPVDPWWHEAPIAEPACDDGGLHLALCSLTEQADPLAQSAIADVSEAIVGLGAHIVDRLDFAELDIDPGIVRRRGLLLVETAAAAQFADEYAAGSVPEPLRPFIEYGQSIDGPRLWGAVRDLVAYRRRVREAFVGIDVLVLPTTPAPAPLIGEDPSNAADFTAWINVAGLPVVVIPWRDSSVQLVGRPGSDDLLLDLARRLHETSLDI